MSFTTEDGREWFICGWCGQTKRREEASTTSIYGQLALVKDTKTDRYICVTCHRPITIRLSAYEAQNLHDLVENHKWLYDHVDEVLFECNCTPMYESDTNATIHADNCRIHIPDHLLATESQAREIIGPQLPKMHPSFLEDME